MSVQFERLIVIWIGNLQNDVFVRTEFQGSGKRVMSKATLRICYVYMCTEWSVPITRWKSDIAVAFVVLCTMCTRNHKVCLSLLLPELLNFEQFGGVYYLCVFSADANKMVRCTNVWLTVEYDSFDLKFTFPTTADV